MGLEFRLYEAREPQQRRAFGEFVEAAYGPAFFLHDSEYVEWWFGAAPGRPASDGGCDIVLAWQGDEVVGMNGHIATPTHVPGRGVEAVHWLANTMVTEAYRRRGLGAMLLRDSLKRYPLVGSISFKPEAARILEHLGFATYGRQGMQRAVALASPESFAAVPCAAAWRETLLASPEAVRGTEEIARLSVGQLGEVAALWRRVRERYGMATERCEAFLRWRYLAHPAGHYHLLGLWECHVLKAVAVLRREGTPHAVIRMLDLFGETHAVAPLLRLVRCWAQAQGAAFADFFCTGCPDRAAFEEAGFHWLPDGEQGALPFLLQPMCTDRPYHEQLALWGETLDVPDYASTYFVRGDSDRDRPQAATLMRRVA